MKSFVEMWHRPFRRPRQARHVLMPELICMDWEEGLTLAQIEIVEYIPEIRE